MTKAPTVISGHAIAMMPMTSARIPRQTKLLRMRIVPFTGPDQPVTADGLGMDARTSRTKPTSVFRPPSIDDDGSAGCASAGTGLRRLGVIGNVRPMGSKPTAGALLASGNE